VEAEGLPGRRKPSIRAVQQAAACAIVPGRSLS
jgi:hypothetical protein